MRQLKCKAQRAFYCFCFLLLLLFFLFFRLTKLGLMKNPSFVGLFVQIFSLETVAENV